VFDLGARRAKRLVLEYVHAGCQLDAPSVVGVSQVKGGQPGPVPDEDPAWVERTGDRPGFERCSGFGGRREGAQLERNLALVRFEPSRPPGIGAFVSPAATPSSLTASHVPPARRSRPPSVLGASVRSRPTARRGGQSAHRGWRRGRAANPAPLSTEQSAGTRRLPGVRAHQDRGNTSDSRVRA